MKLYVYNFRYSHNSIDVCESRLSLHKTTPGTHMVYERGVNFVCIGLHCIHQFIGSFDIEDHCTAHCTQYSALDWCSNGGFCMSLNRIKIELYQR